MTKKYNTLVYLGRFQPVHNAHLETIKIATKLADQVIIIIGSADEPRTPKNPFTSIEREKMIHSALVDAGIMSFQYKIEHNHDTIYNDVAWATRVQGLVTKHTHGIGTTGIIGHDKDASTWYMAMFPQWKTEDVGLIEPLNATDIRELFFRPDVNLNFMKHVVPQATYDFLNEFRTRKEFTEMVAEKDFITEHKKQYAGLRYPPIFVTVDACLVQSGHVLMIKRKAIPGKGLWALPGGYVNANTDSSVKDAMVRELREETGIKVPGPVLMGNIVKEKVFDAVNRSPRGRIITHCFRIDLPDGPLPRVKGDDDAEKARWIPVSDIRRDISFEDHFAMITDMLGLA
jgi:bifunctional NMN adenylyltransferase/nudix hydrolase